MGASATNGLSLRIIRRLDEEQSPDHLLGFAKRAIYHPYLVTLTGKVPPPLVGELVAAEHVPIGGYFVSPSPIPGDDRLHLLRGNIR